MADVTAVDIGLFAIFVVVLVGPFLWKRIEQNLEAFLFVMGVIAASIAAVWTLQLVKDALIEPILKGIVPAVLLAGIVFHYGRRPIDRGMKKVQEKLSLKWIVFLMVVGLGLISSIITAIISALLLVEMVHLLPLDKKTRVEIVVITCFSIGLGAVLTPLGEPLSTIAITALQGPPHNADFFFLLRVLGVYVFPGVVVFGLIATVFVEGTHKHYFYPAEMIGRIAERKKKNNRPPPTVDVGGHSDPGHGRTVKDEEDVLVKEHVNEVFVRALKVYIFVLALIFLGAGMKVIIDKYLTQIPAMALYWVNTMSAILDNATLTAAEIGPQLSITQIKGALMGLLIAGGMLIPGNIPNIISAQKLKITSREWARLGIPLGMATMIVYFVWLYFIPFP